eukprot:scaffold826_cov87-Skeletonema_dohrnii-CCMP3373.AAC.1
MWNQRATDVAKAGIGALKYYRGEKSTKNGFARLRGWRSGLCSAQLLTLKIIRTVRYLTHFVEARSNLFPLPTTDDEELRTSIDLNDRQKASF